MTLAPRIGRWEVLDDEEVVLLGSHCTTCDETLFPERTVCSRCGARTIESVRLRGPATLMAHTVVHQVPAGFTGPVVVGYGRLAGDVVVLAPIDADPSSIHHDMAIDLLEGVTSIGEDGAPFRTYRYRPAAG